ncbi:MAG: hypothetical protein JSU70_19680 [Phycisphaerales bacterium]|nr:MAG: hypothetical protein JSU70_19680 [Phycisphaerales bacterium]
MMAGQTLGKYRKNYYSQNGEDGVLEEILKRLKITDGFCVEFGAWDGKHLSNTYHLIEQGTWKGLYIEADAAKFAELTRNEMVLSGRVIPVNAYVAAQGRATLDNILAKYGVPRDFELLSIDIDGDDLNVWKSVVAHRPRIVIIEIDSDIDPTVSRLLRRGHPERSFANTLTVGQQKGYALVCHTGNMFFVANELVGELGIEDEIADPVALFCDEWMNKDPRRLRRFLRDHLRPLRAAFSSKRVSRRLPSGEGRFGSG